MQRYVLLFVKDLIAREIKPYEVIFFCVSYYFACYFRCKREIENERQENSFQ